MATPKYVTVANPERMSRTKSAMITMVNGADQCRLGDTWYSVRESNVPMNSSVDEVNHFGRHTTAPGDVLIVRGAVERKPVAHIQVSAITLRHTGTFDEEEFAALGYQSREEFDADWGKAFAGRVWFMRIVHLTPQDQLSNLPQ